MSVGDPIEVVCPNCGFETSSGLATQLTASRRAFPDECPNCGSSLKPAGGSA